MVTQSAKLIKRQLRDRGVSVAVFSLLHVQFGRCISCSSFLSFLHSSLLPISFCLLLLVFLLQHHLEYDVFGKRTVATHRKGHDAVV